MKESRRPWTPFQTSPWCTPVAEAALQPMVRRGAVSTVVAFAAATSMPAQAASRSALVIGNGACENAPVLAHPVNDTRAMAAKRENLGLRVFEPLDPGRREMGGATRAGIRSVNDET